MDDLVVLNEKILIHMGVPETTRADCLDLLTLCVGRFAADIDGMKEALSAANKHENTLDVIALNRQYLEVARLISRDILVGRYEGVLIMGVSFAQAQYLAQLSSVQLRTIAKRWDGLVFKPMEQLRHATTMHRKSVPHFATALLAA